MRRGLAPSREKAQDAIASGRVLVAGTTADKAARLVDPAEPIELTGEPDPYVSRGGRKLDAALDAFGVDPAGSRCLDIGSSTGGFTDRLLQGGAREVIAVDVGTGQLDWGLRNDPRVQVVERTDVRDLDPGRVGPVDLVTCDLSFISLRTVLGAIAALAGDAPVVALVKPQFEVGRGRVGKGGVVRDPGLWSEAVDGVVAAAAEAGLRCRGSVASPFPGAEGNREFFVLLGRSAGGDDG